MHPENSCSLSIDWEVIQGMTDIGWVKNSEVAKLTIDHCRDAIFWHRGTRIVYVNEQACRSLGYSRDELESMTLDEIDDGLSPSEKRDLMGRILQNGSGIFETINVRKDGSRFPVELSVTVHRIGGEMLFCGIARDITERRASEEQLRRSQHALEQKIRELRAAESRYNLAIEGGRLGTFEWILSDGGGCVSDSVFRIFGRQPGVLRPTYRAFAEHAHPHDLKRLERVFGVAQKMRRPVSQEARIFWPDGSMHWIEIRARFAYDDFGQPVRLDGVMIDIDEKKTAQARLQSSEQALKLALDAGEMGTWEWNLQTDYVECSDHALRIFGYTVDQIIPTFQIFQNHLHPDDRSLVLNTLAESRERRREHHLEHRIITAGGEVRWIEARGRFQYDVRGHAIRMRGVVLDITRRKNAEEELELRRFAVDVAAEALFTLTLDGRFIDVNQVACQRLGYDREELLRMSVPDISASHSAERFREHMEILRAERVRVIPGIHRRRDGSLIDVEISARIFEYQGQEYICATARDITKLKRAEEKQRELDQQLAHMNRLAGLGEMAGTIAHELNQPLAVIANGASLLQNCLESENPNRAEIAELSELVSEQAVVAGEIVRRMRGFCLNKPPQRASVDLGEVIEESVQLLRPALRHASINVLMELDPIADMMVDRVQIQQVLVNLIHNAIDSMMNSPSDQRQLSVSTACDSELTVRIIVADSGPGISPEQAERIFVPFASSKLNGMGMGLPISRSIIEAHGGRLILDRTVSPGAAFCIELPRDVPVQKGSAS